MRLWSNSQFDSPRTPVLIPIKVFGFRRSAIIELVIILISLQIIDYVFFDGSAFKALNPNPFWIPIVLMAVKYGTRESLLTAIFASVLYFSNDLPEKNFTQDSYTYLLTVSSDPLLWFVTAIIVGEICGRRILEKQALRVELANTDQRNAVISDAYEKLKLSKIDIDARIASQLNTISATYRAARHLTNVNLNGFPNWVRDLVLNTLAPEKFSMFVIKGDYLNLQMRQGWKLSDYYHTKIPANTALFKHIVDHQNFLCVTRENEDKILNGQGTLAGPLVDGSNGRVFGMLKIESQRFIDFNQASVESFHILCDWIGEAYTELVEKEQKIERKIANSPLDLQLRGLKRKSDNRVERNDNTQFSVSLVYIECLLLDDIRLEKYFAFSNAVFEAREKLRNTDSIFKVGESGDRFILLLPETGLNDAKIVSSKYEVLLRRRLPKTIRQTPFKVQVKEMSSYNYLTDKHFTITA